ncbi:hypothetical protein [Lutibacter citreus]|uniref:hypothetical protein n=1 Tax=Lutibacter citreus TaxID=2138210 RepID=UPI000DBE7D19|nr:hypothetical protein [Lutibacter citreus]
MEKLNKNQFTNVLKDVRASYRLLALYQKRLLDVITFVGNSYNVNFYGGWAKFSNSAAHATRAKIDRWSWDWLSMYLYEFNMGEIGKETDIDKYHFRIVHQADTGFFDANDSKKIGKNDIDQFEHLEASTTRLFFVISKNENYCPLLGVLNENLSSASNKAIVKGNWLAVPYNMERFINQKATDLVLKDFNEVCKATFNIELSNQVF